MSEKYITIQAAKKKEFEEIERKFHEEVKHMYMNLALSKPFEPRLDPLKKLGKRLRRLAFRK